MKNFGRTPDGRLFIKNHALLHHSMEIQGSMTACMEKSEHGLQLTKLLALGNHSVVNNMPWTRTLFLGVEHSRDNDSNAIPDAFYISRNMILPSGITVLTGPLLCMRKEVELEPEPVPKKQKKKKGKKRSEQSQAVAAMAAAADECFEQAREAPGIVLSNGEYFM